MRAQHLNFVSSLAIVCLLCDSEEAMHPFLTLSGDASVLEGFAEGDRKH